MEYTKGDRILYCGEEKWHVLIKDKPNRPDIRVGAVGLRRGLTPSIKVYGEAQNEVMEV